MQPAQTPPAAPPAVPATLPKKTPINVAALKMKMSPSVLATLAAAGVKSSQPRPTDAADEEDALLGLKPAAAAAAAPPQKVRRVERAPSSSSSSSSDSSSDEDSSSNDSSESDSDSSSDDGSTSSAASSTASTESEKESTLFDIARSQGLVNKEALSQAEEEESASTVPPRPPIVRSFPTDIAKTLERYRERLNREENVMRMKDDNKAVSLGTSKINYIDPRIVCSWAKAQDVPINKVFSATIIKKFPWAMNAENFDF